MSLRFATTAIFLILVACYPAAGQPRKEHGKREADLIELTTLDKTIKLDIRYATSDNFVGRPVYPEARAFLQRPAAEAIVRVHRRLENEGLGLVIFDGYRPWTITKLFWETVREDQKKFVADPAKGSKHNRGCAVDLSIYDLRTGELVPMPSGYDEFSDRASPGYSGGTEDERANRDKLRRLMEAEGFIVNDNEWWHFDYQGWEQYAISDVAFDKIRDLSALDGMMIRRIEITGNISVRDRDIRAKLSLREGNLFKDRDLLESVKGINSMGRFAPISEQNFQWLIDAARKDVDLVIHLREVKN